MKTAVYSVFGILLGIGIGYYLFFYSPQTLVHFKKMLFPSKQVTSVPEKRIIGFLPYFLVDKAKLDYGNDITVLTYFGLTIGVDGHIQYLANDTEEEPDFHTLKSEKVQKMLDTAKKNDQTLSLLLFSGDSEAIDTLISDPVTNANHLIDDVKPEMKKYGFTDLNLDIESTTQASDTARENMKTFLQTVKNGVIKNNLGTLTIEITGNDLIKKQIISPKDLAEIADYVVIMAYDFHYPGSIVTGAVAPIGGGLEDSEFDTNIVLSQAYKAIPREKIILGVPTYGYSWETLSDSPKSATLPGSGLAISSNTATAFLDACSSCSAVLDAKAQEKYIVYKDQETGTYHQMFVPDADAIQQKVNLVKKNNLGGLAIWALGYEDNTILRPIAAYKTDIVDLTRL